MKKTLVLSALTLSIVAFGCNSDNNDRQVDLGQGTVEPGTFVSDHCFENRIQTDLALGSPRYSNATITINPDNSGSATYSNYTDPACTIPTTDGSNEEKLTFSAISAVSDSGVDLLKFDQSGTVLNPTWYIPAFSNNEGYVFDVDYTDGQSGPYITLPSGAEVSDFGSNHIGVTFKKQ